MTSFGIDFMKDFLMGRLPNDFILNSQKYAAVFFTDDDTIEVVLSIWLREDGKKCFLPNKGGPSFFSKALKNSIPADDTWPQYDCDVLLSTNDYEKAQDKAKRSREDIEVCKSTDNEEANKKRRTKNKPYNDSQLDEYLYGTEKYLKTSGRKNKPEYELPAVPMFPVLVLNDDNTVEAEGGNIELIDSHHNEHIEDFLKDNCKNFSDVHNKENSFDEEILPVDDFTKQATVNDIPTKGKPSVKCLEQFGGDAASTSSNKTLTFCFKRKQPENDKRHDSRSRKRDNDKEKRGESTPKHRKKSPTYKKLTETSKTFTNNSTESSDTETDLGSSKHRNCSTNKLSMRDISNQSHSDSEDEENFRFLKSKRSFQQKQSSSKNGNTFSTSKSDKVISEQKFQKQVLYTLNDLKQQVANISTSVRHISSVLLEKETFENDEMCDIQFPLKTLAQLKDLEDRMSDKEFSKQMIRKLSSWGGNNVKNTTRRILYEVIPKPLIDQFNWIGANGKESLRKLTLINVIKSAVRGQPKHTQATDFEMEKVMKAFVKHKADQNGGRKLRENKQQQ